MNMTTLSPLEFYALVNYRLTLPQMIAETKFDNVNSDITPERFPVVGSGTKKYKFKIFEPRHNISSEDAVEMMRKEGFPAARHEEGLAFAREFPNEQLKRLIVLLGSSVEWDDLHRVLYFDMNGTRMDLSYWRRGRRGWSTYWGFLGAQEVSGA